MMPIVIELLGEPKGNGRPRFGKGFTYTPAKSRNYEAQLALAAAAVMNGRTPIEGPLMLTVTAFMPIPRSWSRKRQNMAAAGDILPTSRPDADNLLKSLDGLNGITWRDDSQVVTLSLTKRYSARPRLVITINEVVACNIAEAAAA
jgi:Holliday junction resolvase RusA-like endonuclease